MKMKQNKNVVSNRKVGDHFFIDGDKKIAIPKYKE